MKLLILIFVSLWSMESHSWAQAAGNTIIVNNGNFFMALIAGVLLALGFQIVLTILSMAFGVSLFGNIEDKFNKPSIQTEKNHERGNPFLKMANVIGAWTVITAMVSLFFASKLAVKIGMVGNTQTALSLGLTVWATFFIIVTYIEMQSARSILGGFYNIISNGMKSSANLVKGMFGKSDAEKTVEAVRSEIVQALKDPHFQSSINGYIRKLQPPPFDWHKARKELSKLLSEMELKVNDKEGTLEKETFISLAHKHPHFNKEDISKLGEIYDEVKNNIQSKMSGMAQDSGEIKEKIANYLKNSGVQALNPESLKADLNKIVSDPKSTKSVVLNRIKQFDHPTIVSIVSKANMTQEQANQVVEKVETVLESIKEKVVDASSKGAGVREAVESKIKNYFESLQRPEVNYDVLKADFERMLHDPQMSFEILKSRLQSFDKETLVSFLDSLPNVSKQDAEKIIAKVEEAKSNVLQKAQEIETKVNAKVQEAKESAIKQAEYVRETVVVSAWWIVVTAVLSASASAIGAMQAAAL